MKKNTSFSVIKSYKFNSIFFRNFISLLLITLIPILLIGVISYNYFKNSQTEEMERAKQEALAGVASTFDIIYSESERILLHITMDEYISSLTKLKPSTYSEKMSFIASVSKIINTLTFHEEYIHSINLYFEENDFFYSTTGDNGSINTISDLSWYDAYLKNRDKVDFWVESRSTTGHAKQEVVSIYKFISSSSDSHSVAIININRNKLDSLLYDAIGSEGSSFYALDENGKVIYSISSDKAFPVITDFTEILSGIRNSQLPSSVSVDKENYMLSYMKSGYKRWNYASLTNLKSYNKSMNALLFFTLASFLCMLLIEVIIAFYLSMKMYKPIKKIIDLLDNPQKWVSATSDNLVIGANELKYIEHNILNNYHESSKLKNELDNKLVSLKKATAIALQSQINPHFLYNTLESINWKARRLLGAENEVSDMLLTLSRVLRYNLNPTSSFITLEEEIKHAQIYMSLQSSRYKNKFETEFYISEDLSDIYVIKFLLQPILENAIYHGIKPAERKCIIRISAHQKDNSLIITVSDNGVGINEEKLKKLNHEFSENSENFTKHIGLINTNQRIKLLCGEKYGISINSIENEGTDVIITLPTSINYELNES